MKRLLAMILIGIICLGSVAFGAVAHEFDLNHEVARDSSIAYTVNGEGKMIAKVNKLGNAIINNNTMDGWKLTVLSANAGQFTNTSTGNGEVPINYSLDIKHITGAIGDGIHLAESLDLGASESFICDLESGSNQNSATVNLKLGFEVDFSKQGPLFEMAGTYSDTLTITYADI